MALDDTQPSLAVVPQAGLKPPPRFLLYAALIILALMLITPLAGIYVFREVLRPSQQQRVIGMIAFMEVFLPPRPAPGDTLPTVVPGRGSGTSPEDLLGLSLATLMPETDISPTIMPTATDIPFTPSQTPIPSPTVVQTAATVTAPIPTDVANSVSNVPVSGRMYGFRHEQQTWNNCGPATVTIALSYYGWEGDQAYAKRVMRPDREDKNVTPDEMVAFVNEQTGVRALWRRGGTSDLLRLLIANDFPVIIGTGYMPEGYDWLGHYQTVVGFEGNTFYLYDSFIGTGENGEGYARSEDDVDRDWRHFNRRFIVLFPPDREALLLRLLGDRSDANQAAELAFLVAQDEARANPNDGYAWFNMGTALVDMGRYEEAASAFDRATQAGLPWRMLWYQFEPYEAYFNVGRYSDVLSLAQANLSNGGQYVEETYFWQGQVQAAQGMETQARTSYRNALGINPNYEDARQALELLG